jgi:hypothetical protein
LRISVRSRRWASAFELGLSLGAAAPEVDAAGVFDEPAVPDGTKDTADEFAGSALNKLDPASCEGPGLLSGVDVLVDK